MKILCNISCFRATHGAPSEINCHPQRSDDENEFVVVHNGIITNYKDVKLFLQSKGKCNYRTAQPYVSIIFWPEVKSKDKYSESTILFSGKIGHQTFVL